MERAIAKIAALQAFMHASDSAARGTGRTTAMIKAASEGDFIVVPNDGCRRHIEYMVREHFGRRASKPRLTVIVAGPNLHQLAELLQRRVIDRRERGKVHIDHFWIEQFVAASLAHELKRIADFSKTVLSVEIEPAALPSFDALGNDRESFL